MFYVDLLPEMQDTWVLFSIYICAGSVKCINTFKILPVYVNK